MQMNNMNTILPHLLFVRLFMNLVPNQRASFTGMGPLRGRLHICEHTNLFRLGSLTGDEVELLRVSRLYW